MNKAILVRLVFATLPCGSCAEANETEDCVANLDAVLPDDVVHGTRVGDILEPYFGTYSGRVSFSGGESTFTFSVAYHEGDPFRLWDVRDCRAYSVDYFPEVRLVTADGAIDREVATTMLGPFPDPPPPLRRPSVLLTGWETAESWGAELLTRLTVSLDDYEHRFLGFRVDWPLDSAPQGAELIFKGTRRDSGLVDEVVVGTFVFDSQ